MREKILLFVVAALLLFVQPAQAQQHKKLPRIGWIDIDGSGPRHGFLTGLRERGYVEGQSVIIEYRSAQGRYERLSEIANELASLKVDAIVTFNNAATNAARKATTTIPIVFVTYGDPVGDSLIASLARPAGNITGLSFLAVELSGKRLELLRDVFPKISRVAVLLDPDAPVHRRQFVEMKNLAKTLGIELLVLGPRGHKPDFKKEFQAAIAQRANALITLPDPVRLNRKAIVNLAAKSRLPVMYPEGSFTEAGGLMSYGLVTSDLYLRAASLVDKILRGSKPSDLPVEQPTKFEFVINLKTAKEIGVTIPPDVLMWADRVIK